MLQPWVSSEDIDAGKRWGSQIEGELKATKVGILCVTPTNLKEPWLLFEGGALANQVGETARVIPYLFGMTKLQLKGPLSAFQAVEADEDGTFELLKSINKALDDTHRRPETELKEAFDAFWPKLKVKLDKISEDVKKRDEPKAPSRETNDLLEEVLTLVRQIDRRMDRPVLAEGRLPALAAGILAKQRRALAEKVISTNVLTNEQKAEFFNIELSDEDKLKFLDQIMGSKEAVATAPLKKDEGE